MRTLALAAAAFGALALPAAAQERPMTAHPMILEGTALTVTAEARASAKPDIATVAAGVVNEAPTAEAALAENGRRMTAVLAAIRRAGVADRDVQTSQLSIQPQMVYAENLPPRVTGYQATNTVSVKVRNMANVGRVVDAIVAQSGNQLNGVSFGLDDPDAALDGARAEALKRARARGELYAQAAGLRLHRIVAISESGGVEPPRPMPMLAMARAEGATPVAPGEVQLTAAVTVTFELR
jgi:hypothetical protein